MRKFSKHAAASILMLSCAGCMAADKKEAALPSFKQAFHGGIDVAVTRHSVDASDHLRAQGMMYGLKVGYEISQPEGWYGAVDLAYSPGRSKSNVSTVESGIFWDTDHQSYFENSVKLLRYEAKVGHEFTLADPLKVIPFVSIGHNRLDLASKFMEDDFDAYDNHYRAVTDYVHCGVGMKLAYQMLPSLNVGLGLKGTNCFWGQNAVTYFDATETVEFKNKFGYEISLPLSWSLGDQSKMSFKVDPYFLKMSTSDSLEIYGLRLAMDYAF